MTVKKRTTKPPYGYAWHDGQLILVPEEVPIYKELIELYLLHQRKRTVARLLNEKGYRTRAGKKFSYSAVDRMLKNPVAKGTYFYSIDEKGRDKPSRIEMSVPQIIDEQTWNHVQQIMNDQGGKQTRTVSQDIFVGKVICECDKSLKIPSKSTNYSCKKCGADIAIEDIHALFEKSIEDLTLPDSINLNKKSSSEINKSKSVVLNKIAQIERDIEKLFELYSLEAITPEIFKERHEKLDTQLKQLKNNVKNKEKDGPQKHDSIYDFWESANITSKQLFVDTLLDRIELKRNVASIYLFSLFNFAQQSTVSAKNGAPSDHQ